MGEAVMGEIVGLLAEVDLAGRPDKMTAAQVDALLAKSPRCARWVIAFYPEHATKALAVDGMALDEIGKARQTFEEVDVAVRQNGCALRHAYKPILESHPGLYGVAVRGNGLSLQHVPDDRRDRATCDAAVAQNGLALEFVPRWLRSKAICAVAVEGNGLALRFVPAELVDRGLCLAAVGSAGKALEFVPQALIDVEVARAALVNDGDALPFVPKETLTKELCEVAVCQRPVALRHVPARLRDSEMIWRAVDADWRAVQYVSRPAKRLLMRALEQSPQSLAHKGFPDKWKTEGLCCEAVERDPRVLPHIPPEFVKPAMLRAWLRTFDAGRPFGNVPSYADMRWLAKLDARLLEDREAGALLRAMGRMEVASARWSEGEGAFVVTQKVTVGHDPSVPADERPEEPEAFSVTSRPRGLTGLAELLDGDLSPVGFSSYAFEDYDPALHDLSTAHAGVDVLRRVGAYDEGPYRRHVANSAGALGIMLSAKGEAESEPAGLVRADLGVLPYGEEPPVLRARAGIYYYVSDLHLNHKLDNRFRGGATRLEMREYLEGLARGLAESVPPEGRWEVLLVLGDTSYDMEVARVFFAALKGSWEGPIAVVLGNHELWDYGGEMSVNRPTPTVEDVVGRWRAMLGQHGIELLQDELLACVRGREWRRIDRRLLDEANDEELAFLLRHCGAIILGGLGFTGLCDGFNAEEGQIYRDVVATRAEDRARSEHLSEIHERLRRLVPEAKVVVATHTPMDQWSSEPMQPGWVYASGHTHRNAFHEGEDGVRSYADNQVGYRGTRAGLKRFHIDGTYDPFRTLEDGIHVVKRTDYLDFNRARDIVVGSFTREGTIYALKRDGVYLFLFRWDETQKLYLLSGGSITGLKRQDPAYYYENMAAYASAVRAAFSGYTEALEAIAAEVRAIGGQGTIHGAIVDIDFYNHVYLDPRTGKVTFYYAEWIPSRVAYDRIDDLLEAHCPQLLGRYRELLLACSGEGRAPLLARGRDEAIAKARVELGTLMYRDSRVLLDIERILSVGVIRLWNEEVVAKWRAGLSGQAGLPAARR